MPPLSLPSCRVVRVVAGVGGYFSPLELAAGVGGDSPALPPTTTIKRPEPEPGNLWKLRPPNDLQEAIREASSLLEGGKGAGGMSGRRKGT